MKIELIFKDKDPFFIDIASSFYPGELSLILENNLETGRYIKVLLFTTYIEKPIDIWIENVKLESFKNLDKIIIRDTDCIYTNMGFTHLQNYCVATKGFSKIEKIYIEKVKYKDVLTNEVEYLALEQPEGQVYDSLLPGYFTTDIDYQIDRSGAK